jgi:hypothetical protein
LCHREFGYYDSMKLIEGIGRVIAKWCNCG